MINNQEKKKISAKIVADSINPQGDRVTTLMLTFPRFILPELNTHRVFSKNSASSRAIPFKKMVEMVESDPFIPIAFQKEHKGMQGTEYWTDKADIQNLERRWKYSANNVIEQAKNLHEIGCTKQLTNRILEPFMWHTVLLTGTEFENFFNLRCPKYELINPGIDYVQYLKSKKDWAYTHDVLMNTRPRQSKENILKEKELILKIIPNGKYDEIEWIKLSKSQAEIHMQALAEAMWDAMNESVPKVLEAGEWHMPFMGNFDVKKLLELSGQEPEDFELVCRKIATARAARLSYMTFDGVIDYEKDIQLHDILLKSKHMSPFEHCARVMTEQEYDNFIKGDVRDTQIVFNSDLTDGKVRFNENVKGWCNNFRGFIPYRYLIDNGTTI